MSPSRRSVVLGAAAAVVPAAARPQVHSDASPAHHGAGHRDAFASEVHRLMRAMMDAMDRASMSGDPDRDFLAMMIPHHQGAVDMARLVLVHGRDPLTRQLAEQIIASQTSEIASMQARLRAFDSGGPNVDGFPQLSGTRGE